LDFLLCACVGIVRSLGSDEGLTEVVHLEHGFGFNVLCNFDFCGFAKFRGGCSKFEMNCLKVKEFDFLNCSDL
jgi:hypothetical protein